MSLLLSALRRTVTGGVAVAALLAFATQAHAWRLTVGNVNLDACPGTVEVELLVDQPTGPVDAFGFDITFSNPCLTFQAVTKGPLTSSWALVSGFTQPDGELRIAGIPFTGQPFEAAGLLATIRFGVNCVDGQCLTTLTPKDLVDDFQDATVVAGTVSIGVTVPEGEGEGVVEGEGEGTVEGAIEGEGEGSVEGAVEGEGEGSVEGAVEGEGEGTVEGAVEGEGEGSVEGAVEGEGEGSVEGAVEGEGEDPVDLPPTVSCQNMTLDLVNGFALLDAAAVTASATDDNGTPTLSVDPSFFGCDALGEQTVTVTARDSIGQTATCTATVTVVDSEAPIVACKRFVTTLNLEGVATVTVEDVNDNSRDACGIETLELSKTEFTCADRGTNEVTLTVTDVNGNVASCVAEVVISDPIPSCFEALTFNLSVTASGNGTATIETAPNAADGLSYTDGTSVVIRQAANQGAQFKEWTGDTDGGNIQAATITVVMNKNRAIQAVFEDSAVQGCGSFPGCNIQGPPSCNIQGTPTCNLDTPQKAVGDMFLGALTLIALLGMTAYQKRRF